MSNFKNLTLAVAVGVVAWAAGAANAAPLPSTGAPLTAGMSFSVSDKTFTIDSVTNTTNGTASIGALTVIPDITFVSGLGNVGIGFDIVGSVFALGFGSSADVLIKYHVHVDAPGVQISDAHLFIAGSPSDGVGVDEVLLNGVNSAGGLNVTGLSPTDNLMPLMTGPVTDLDVTKDIFAISTGSLVQWSAVGQLFTQTNGNNNVPEPLTLLLFGGGLACLGFARRRKSS